MSRAALVVPRVPQVREARQGQEVRYKVRAENLPAACLRQNPEGREVLQARLALQVPQVQEGLVSRLDHRSRALVALLAREAPVNLADPEGLQGLVVQMYQEILAGLVGLEALAVQEGLAALQYSPLSANLLQ